MRKPKRPARTDPAALEAAALRYVERHAATCESLRRVLVRRVRRHAPDTLEAAKAPIEDLVARFERAGLVNDRAFASMRAASLERAGASPRLIKNKLAEKGVAPALISETIAELGTEGAVELRAAVAYAKRRRLGPFGREPLTDPEQRKKALAALGRRGFSFEVARRVIDAKDAEALLATLED